MLPKSKRRKVSADTLAYLAEHSKFFGPGDSGTPPTVDLDEHKVSSFNFVIDLEPRKWVLYQREITIRLSTHHRGVRVAYVAPAELAQEVQVSLRPSKPGHVTISIPQHRVVEIVIWAADI